MTQVYEVKFGNGVRVYEPTQTKARKTKRERDAIDIEKVEVPPNREKLCAFLNGLAGDAQAVTLFRVQASTGDGWVNQFEPSEEEARATHAALCDVYGEVRIDEVLVDTSREGIALALNHADASHMNWTGEGRIDR